uniref:Uncharacterized protein n=1 Tax=Triticum urartu TaxID=4572 RepID=A0A8R7PXB0_TRIUA
SSSFDLPCVEEEAEIGELVGEGGVGVGRGGLGLEDEEGLAHAGAEEPVVGVPVDLHLHLVDGDAVVAPELPLEVLDEHVDAAVDLDGHVHVRAAAAAAEVAAAALDADVVQLPLLVEPRPGQEPLLAEHVLLLAHHGRVPQRQRRPGPRPPERLLVLVAEQEHHLLAGDHRHVVVRHRLRLVGEPRRPQVPHHVHRPAVHLELLGPVLAPEVPRLHLHLARAAALIGAALDAAAAALVLAAAGRPLDGHLHAVGQQVPAPRDGDQPALPGDHRAVHQRHRALPRPGRRRRRRRRVRQLLLARREAGGHREQVLHPACPSPDSTKAPIH